MRPTLESNAKLAFRMKSLVRIRGEKLDIPGVDDDEVSVPNPHMLDLDGQDISTISELPEGITMLSLCSNPITDHNFIYPLLPQLKALWIDETPICSDEYQEKALLQEIEENFPNVEIFNAKFTINASEWALKFCAKSKDLASVTDLDLSDRHIQRADPGILAPLTSLINLDCRGNTVTENWVHALAKLPLKRLQVDVQYEELIWHFISEFPGLKYINNWDVVKGKPDMIDVVQYRLWQYAGTYRLASEEQLDESNVWYVMDEFGSTIGHSDQANVAIFPFLYQPPSGDPVAYSLMWPVRPIANGDILYRDMLNGVTEQQFRSSRLAAWFQVPKKYFQNQYDIINNRITSAHLEPEGITSHEIPALDLPVKLCTDMELFLSTLTDERFQFVPREEANVIWSHSQVIIHGEWQTEILAHQYFNQFPYEAAFVSKNGLAKSIQYFAGDVEWFQRTYELNTELPAMMGDFYRRERLGLDNHWILKPTNMSRGMDTLVTNNLDCIIRQMETGPKICQKYIERPLLINGKKFDLRFIVLLRSIEPLKLYCYDKFWVRTANKPFSLSYKSDPDYETHFTVMNYSAYQLKTVMYHEFIESFERETGRAWAPVLENIYQVFRQVFLAAKKSFPEMHNEKSRAIYGFDIMLDEDCVPKVLELNYCPDCKRATVQFPSFTNDIFSCLFLGEKNNIVEI
jgi:tubulin--tyrosine ligase-like protein 12